MKKPEKRLPALLTKMLIRNDFEKGDHGETDAKLA